MTTLDFWLQPMWLAWVDLVLVVLAAAFFWTCREWSRNLHEVPLLALGVPVPRQPAWAPAAPVYAATASSAIGSISGLTAAYWPPSTGRNP